MNKKNTGLIIIAVFTGVCIFFALYGKLVYYTWPQWETRGQFGDMYGTLNAFFSAFALVGVIIAIFLQRKDIELQKEDLNLTREELRGQKEMLKKQYESMRLQQFENTFFQLMKLHHQITESFLYKGKKGSECFIHAIKKYETIMHNISFFAEYVELKERLEKEKYNGHMEKEKLDSKIKKIELDIWEYYEILIGFEQYVNNIESVYDLIKKYQEFFDINDYESILLSQLSMNEKMFIALYVNKYAFSDKNINIDLITIECEKKLKGDHILRTSTSKQIKTIIDFMVHE